MSISEPYQDCLRDVLASVRGVSARLDREGWQPMTFKPGKLIWPSSAM